MRRAVDNPVDSVDRIIQVRLSSGPLASVDLTTTPSQFRIDLIGLTVGFDANGKWLLVAEGPVNDSIEPHNKGADTSKDTR